MNPYSIEEQTQALQLVHLAQSLLSNPPFNGLNALYPPPLPPVMSYPVHVLKPIDKCEQGDLAYYIEIESYKPNSFGGVSKHTAKVWLKISVIRRENREDLLLLLAQKANLIAYHFGGANLMEIVPRLSLDSAFFHENSCLGNFLWNSEVLSTAQTYDKCGFYSQSFIIEISTKFK